MLAEIVARLACPLCGAALTDQISMLTCAVGHSYDVARQGYVNLLTGRRAGQTETPEMVSARTRFLDGGHYDPLRRAVVELAAKYAPSRGVVVDVGAGTGHYLAAVLDRLDRHHGLALDIAKPAARAAARVHPRAAAAICDVWRGLPLVEGGAGLVLNVFAPRNGPEFRRVLAPAGALLVVTPRADHLAELVGQLGLLQVDPAKDERVRASLESELMLKDLHGYGYPLALSRADAALVVGMGPSAWHADNAAVADRLRALPDPIETTVSVDLRVYARAT